MTRIFLISLLLTLSSYVFAQKSITWHIKPDRFLVLNIHEGYTAFALEGQIDFSNLTARVNGKEIHISNNAHFNNTSNLILFDKAQ